MYVYLKTIFFYTYSAYKKSSYPLIFFPFCCVAMLFPFCYVIMLNCFEVLFPHINLHSINLNDKAKTE